MSYVCLTTKWYQRRSVLRSKRDRTRGCPHSLDGRTFFGMRNEPLSSPRPGGPFYGACNSSCSFKQTQSQCTAADANTIIKRSRSDSSVRMRASTGSGSDRLLLQYALLGDPSRLHRRSSNLHCWVNRVCIPIVLLKLSISSSALVLECKPCPPNN